MTTFNLQILINALKTGQGFEQTTAGAQQMNAAVQQSNNGLKQMNETATQSSLRMAAFQQQQQLVSAKTNELAKSVAQGKMSFEEADTKLRQYKGGLADLGTQTAAADTQSRNFGQTLQQGIDIYTKVVAGVTAVGVTFKKAFDLAEEGAATIQIEKSFDRLNETVFKTPDLLEKLSAAARGTISDVTLMSGVLTLTAGTTGEWGNALAAATPNLVAIAKASNALNPALGTTEMLYEKLSMAIKRQSRLRADDLGLVISMEQATKELHPALQTVADDYEDLTAEQRFLNEALIQGDRLIEQAGGTAESATDAYARFRVKTQELATEFKQWLAEGLTPVVEALSDYGDQAEATIEKNVSQAKSMEDLIEAGKGLNESWGVFLGLGPAITGTQDELKAGIMDIVEQMAVSAPTFEDFEAGIESAFGKRVQNSISETLRQARLSKEEFYQMSRALNEAESADRKFFIAAEAATAATEAQGEASEDAARNLRALEAGASENQTTFQRLVTVLGSTAEALRYMNLVSQDAEQAADAYEVSAEDVAAAEEKREQAHDQATEAAERAAEMLQEIAQIAQQSAEDQIDAAGDLFDAYDDLEAAQGEYVTVYKNNSDEILEIQQQLQADLSDEQEEGLEDQLVELDEFSAEAIAIWNQLQGDLTENQRRELIAQLADLQAAHGEASSVYTGNAEDAEEAQERITAAFARIKQNWQQMVLDIAASKLSMVLGDDAIAIQLVLVDIQEQMGTISSEQAEFMRTLLENTGNAEGALRTLFDEFLADGELSEEEIANVIEAMNQMQTTAVTSESVLVQMGRTGVEEFRNLQGEIGNSRQSIVDMKDAAQEFADGGPYKPVVGIDDQASAGLITIQEYLKGLEDKTIKVTTVYEQEGQPAGGGTTGGGTGNLPGPEAPGQQYGGVISGPPGIDNILTPLTAGEGVLPVRAMDAIGLDLFESLRQGDLMAAQRRLIARAGRQQGVVGGGLRLPTAEIGGLSSGSPSAGSGETVTIENINVYGSEGMSEREMAREMMQRLGAEVRQRVASRAIGSRL